MTREVLTGICCAAFTDWRLWSREIMLAVEVRGKDRGGGVVQWHEMLLLTHLRCAGRYLYRELHQHHRCGFCESRPVASAFCTHA
jgi:hypothetical protein